ncbi:solute carrier organic anion transporter family member 4A1-like [Diadema antillarum]|uniref:solute carrier organic anion transporter family member 4A1-like n=1 Tax=Diadema antillarum TaxID=105358 RepID=UPI003A83C51B
MEFELRADATDDQRVEADSPAVLDLSPSEKKVLLTEEKDLLGKPSSQREAGNGEVVAGDGRAAHTEEPNRTGNGGDPGGGGRGVRDGDTRVAGDLREVGDDEEETACGFGLWHPRFLQFCNSPVGFLVCLCCFGFTQGMTVNGIVYVVTTTLERRFNLPSVQSGFISSAYDFGVLIVVVFVTYLGERAHKPRWLGIGALGFACSSFLFSLPHFTTGAYQYETQDLDTCHMSVNQSSSSEDCTGSSGGLSRYIGVFILAQLLHGFSASGIYTLGVTYIDENVETKRSALYVGLFQGMSTLGPALGYLVGGLFLNLYTDVSVDPASLTITSDSPLWVGAWWLGFILTGSLALSLALPFLMFPRAMPEAKELAKKRISQAQKGSEFAARAGFGNTLRDFPKAALNLLRNLPFMCVNGAAVTEWFIISSLATFGPKFMETQFNISASTAALRTGFLVIPASLLGALCGGWLVTFFNFHFRGMIRFCFGCLVFSFFMLTAFTIQCPNVPFAGVTVDYGNASSREAPSSIGNLSAVCNAGCSCSSTYDPVCGTDNVLYFSACYAGCLNYEDTEGTGKLYTNCSCVSDDLESNSSSSAVLGRCDQSCSKETLYLFLTFVQLVGTFLALVPSTMASIRCVAHDQRSFALGIQSLCFRAFGTIPGPVVFGALIDRVCVLWQDSCDGSACLQYDNKQFGLTALILTMMLRLFSILFFVGALVFYKPTDSQPVEASPEQSSNEQRATNSTA